MRGVWPCGGVGVKLYQKAFNLRRERQEGVLDGRIRMTG